MRNNLEEFLKDNARNKEIFEDNMQNKYVVYKEEVNERFDTIYYKRYSESLSQNDYQVGGFYDRKEHTLYNPNYNIQNMFLLDHTVNIAYLSYIDRDIVRKLNEKINMYLDNNRNKLKQYGKIKFEYLNEYDIRRVKEEMNREFITQLNPGVSLSYDLSTYDLTKLKNYNSNDIYNAYLNNRDELINKLFEEVKNIKKEDLGFAALMYDFKLNYLHELVESGKYPQITINRNIYQSIKDVYARNLNINIGYGENNMNFKFDIDDLKNSLARGDTSTRTYGVNYRKVADFIKENDLIRDKHEDFEFSHINFITHGKDELYNKKNFEKEPKHKNKDREAR